MSTKLIVIMAVVLILIALTFIPFFTSKEAFEKAKKVSLWGKLLGTGTTKPKSPDVDEKTENK